MTIQLPENLESSIREAVHSGQFPSVDDAMAEAARLLLSQLKQKPVTPHVAKEEPVAAPHKPIWEVIEEENQSIPPEIWESLPTDLSEQHDHYIYGTPKRPLE